MQRPPAHVFHNDVAAELVQHVAVDTVDEPVESINAVVVVIDGVQPVAGVAIDFVVAINFVVDFFQFRSIVERKRQHVAFKRHLDQGQGQVLIGPAAIIDRVQSTK